ncbi:uncharacterized protein LOC142768965 [Rhipicephalus microplus]|uniref:uncharacterized protein LOC142768965 n=1 Tax=Rhipicephalus microplus TaxID=6941 RepID=UPI003F6B66CA
MAREQLKWAEIRNAPSYNKLVELLVRTSLLVGFHTVLVIQLLTEDSDAVLRLSSGTSLLHKLTTTGDLWDLEETLRRTTLYEGLDLNNTLSIDDLVNAALYGDRNSTETTVEGDVDGPLEEFLDDLVPDVNATGWIREILGVLSRFGENSLLLSDIATAKGAPLFRRAFGEITSKGGLENTALYLASHLDAEILSLELSRNRLSSEPEDALRFCLAMTQRTLYFSWPRLVASVLQVHGTEHVLETMFDQLKKASHQARMLKWLSTPMRLAAQQRIRLVGLVVTSRRMSGRGGHRRSDAWWTRGAMRKYRISAACFERMHSRLGLQRQLDDSGKWQRHELLLRAQGLRLAYDALLASFGKSVADSEDLKKLWPEAQAEFFARYCLLSCDADPTRSVGPLSPRADCLVALHNMPEFAAAFDCTSREDFVAQQCLP